MAKTKSKKSKIIIIICVIIAIIVIAAIAVISKVASMVSNFSLPVTTTKVYRGAIEEYVDNSGSVVSEKTEAVYAEVNGRIDEVKVAYGEIVNAGDLLANYRLDEAEDSLEQASLQQTRANAAYNKTIADNAKNQAKLNEANLNLGVLKQQIEDWGNSVDKQTTNLEDSQRNTANGLMDKSFQLSQKIEQLSAELATTEPGSDKYKQKEAELKQAKDELSQVQYLQQAAGTSDSVANSQKQIKATQQELSDFLAYEAEMKAQKSTSESMIMDNYQRTELEVDHTLAQMSYDAAQEEYEAIQKGIVAPFKGVISNVSVVKGGGVMPGTAAFTVASTEDLAVVINVAKSDYLKLEIGQKAEIEFGNHKYDGEVTKINHMAEVSNANGAPLVAVTVHVSNPDEKLIMGFEAKVHVLTNKKENALLLPIEAVNADREGDFVYVVKDGIVEKRYVVCGISSGLDIEIVEGLEENEDVIQESMIDITEGMVVSVSDVKNAKDDGTQADVVEE